MGKLLTWRSQILNITKIRHPHVKLYYSKPENLKQIVNKNVPDKLTYDTSWESS